MKIQQRRRNCTDGSVLSLRLHAIVSQAFTRRTPRTAARDSRLRFFRARISRPFGRNAAILSYGLRCCKLYFIWSFSLQMANGNSKKPAAPGKSCMTCMTGVAAQPVTRKIDAMGRRKSIIRREAGLHLTGRQREILGTRQQVRAHIAAAFCKSPQHPVRDMAAGTQARGARRAPGDARPPLETPCHRTPLPHQPG